MARQSTSGLLIEDKNQTKKNCDLTSYKKKLLNITKVRWTLRNGVELQTNMTNCNLVGLVPLKCKLGWSSRYSTFQKIYHDCTLIWIWIKAEFLQSKFSPTPSLFKLGKPQLPEIFLIFSLKRIFYLITI